MLILNFSMDSAIILALGAGGILWAMTLLTQKRKQSHKETLSDAEKPFETPLPPPVKDFKVDETDPHLYRPFRHGKNHITMGIRKLDFTNWIELDSNYMRYHDMKVKQLSGHLTEHVKYVDNAVTRDACFEVLEELARYLTHRYPDIFQLDGDCLSNSATGEKFCYPAANPTEALATAAKLVQDDLVLMVKNDDDGQYHLDAGAVCLPGFWRLKEKLRMSLDTLHIEAGVPHYQAKLQKSMNRFFNVMTPDKPVTRNNFFIQLDDGLNWSHRMGEEYGDKEASWASANDEGLTVEDIYFRSERQTLRRLPRSAALMFTIRTYFEPMTVIAKEPHVPGRLAEAIRAMDETVSAYKGRRHWDHLLLPFLDEQHQKQVESGILEKQAEGEFPY
ncbi:unnamed protein product [Periconia digitata]|uniref:DUF3445 domain-containing protein n=1 Tax=Periconia digitata TaxID=1303443 RepID=A0A9W4UIS3_9PLEO|nr:unnamed protein product [Periconia digitata]